MVIIAPYRTAVSLFHKDGTVVLYASINAARKALGVSWIANNVGKHFCEFSHISYFVGDSPARNVYYDEHDWVMRNDSGEPMTAADFHVERFYRPYGHYAYWNGFGPVPGSRKYRGYSSRFRHIKTMNERRASFPVHEDGEVPPRAARNMVMLPTAWDDLSRSDYGVKNWKRHRKTQWK